MANEERDAALERVMAEVAVNTLKEALGDSPASAEEFLANIEAGRGSVKGSMNRIVDSAEFEDKLPIYSTIDGSPSYVQIAMIPKMLLKKHKNDPEVPPELVGRPAFSLRPSMEWNLPDFLCPLHPDAPEREYYDSIGLRGRICRKATLASEFDQMLHFKNKHIQSWRIAERAREMSVDSHTKTVADAQLNAMLALSKAVEAMNLRAPKENE